MTVIEKTRILEPAEMAGIGIVTADVAMIGREEMLITAVETVMTGVIATKTRTVPDLRVGLLLDDARHHHAQ
jgi:hypothetical protein